MADKNGYRISGGDLYKGDHPVALHMLLEDYKRVVQELKEARKQLVKRVVVTLGEGPTM